MDVEFIRTFSYAVVVMFMMVSLSVDYTMSLWKKMFLLLVTMFIAKIVLFLI